MSLNKLSFYLTSGLIAITVISGLLADFFQGPAKEKRTLGQYEKLIPEEYLSSPVEIDITNKLGLIKLIKNKTWKVSGQSQVQADHHAVLKILEGLKKIQIKQFYQRDKVNLNNYGLTYPSAQITVINQSAGTDSQSQLERVEIKFGILHPIDNTWFVLVEGRNAIYRVEIGNLNISQVKADNLIDFNVINLPREKIASVKIYRANGSRKKTQLNLKKVKGTWVDSKSRPINTEKLFPFLNTLFSLKGKLILDKINVKQEESLKKYLSSPRYILELSDQLENNVTYQISGLIKGLPELNLLKRNNFLIKASNRDHPFLLNKSDLKVFNSKDANF